MLLSGDTFDFIVNRSSPAARLRRLKSAKARKRETFVFSPIYIIVFVLVVAYDSIHVPYLY